MALQLPHLLPNPAVLVGRTIHGVKLSDDGLELRVTVTASLAIAREWVRSIKQSHGHISNLHIGMSCHGNKDGVADVVTICVGRKCLLVQVTGFNQIEGSFRECLGPDGYSVVGFGPRPTMGRGLVIGRYENVLDRYNEPVEFLALVQDVFGKNHHLHIDPETANTDWSPPLTDEQMVFASVEAYVYVKKIRAND